MKRMIALLLMSIVSVMRVAPAWAADARPNIIVILADDMGWRDCEPYGSTFFKTPNLTRLVGQGLKFEQAYAQPLCSPTRAALLSGQYPSRYSLHKAITGGSTANPVVPTKANAKSPMLWPESRSHLPLEQVTIAEVLKDAGYQTWHLGKWHLGHSPKYYPNKQGFEVLRAVGGAGPGSYFSPHNLPYLKNGPDGEYIADRLTDEAIKLLQERDKDRPFFMYFAHFNVHSPYVAKEDVVEKYKATMDKDAPQHNPVMAAMLEGLDDSVGRVMDAVDELGLAENTLLIFVSDNGGVFWAGKSEYGPPTSNLPLRGGKCTVYEGGVRVPMVARWKGKIEPGTTTDVPVHVVDLFPTLLATVGVDKPEDKLLDGVSILPLLKGEGTHADRNLYCHFPRTKTLASEFGVSFVRQGDYKLMRRWGAGADREPLLELYNVKEDIGEANNLAEAMPDKAKAMDADLGAWLNSTGALLPAKNPAFRE